MPPRKCHEMVAHNEYHELSTRNELRVLPIRKSPCKYHEMVAHTEYHDGDERKLTLRPAGQASHLLASEEAVLQLRPVIAQLLY
ncbi:hypothetical protein NDU88_005209 [Pleurodeles waltl]|uniref:Uncharacterized protein n=1 Tax=Pleurodeles waltl TaxID=8319 RepID=A0AAV7WB52_PLEWA|nr:hypothetical protein NDU88_005209 [Pleurodeles waltl]